MSAKSANAKANVKNTRKSARAQNSRRRAGRRRGRRTLHHLLVILFVLTVGVVLSLTVFFQIEDVVVLGSERYVPEEVAASSGIQLEDNLLRISSQEIRETLLAEYPYIETVTVRRRFPSTVEITVTQGEPVGALALSDTEYLLFTKTGKVLERGLLLIPEHVPLIKGIEAGELQAGEYLGEWKEEPAAETESDFQKESRVKRNGQREQIAQDQLSGMKMLTKLFDAIEESGFEDITNVDISDRLNMKIMYENRMLLELGSEAELDYKLTFISRALEELNPDAHGTLDATNVGKKRVSYRPAADYDINGNYLYAQQAGESVQEESELAAGDSGGGQTS